jgi:hypothetical protein
MNLVFFVSKFFCHLHNNPCLEKKRPVPILLPLFCWSKWLSIMVVLFFSFISQFLDLNNDFLVPSFNLLCKNAQMNIFTLFDLNFANVEWHFLFFHYMWQTNLGLLFNIHFLLGLACVLPLMETMQSLFNFVPKGDIFICDFIVVVIAC